MPGKVVVAFGEPGMPVTCWAIADSGVDKVTAIGNKTHNKYRIGFMFAPLFYEYIVIVGYVETSGVDISGHASFSGNSHQCPSIPRLAVFAFVLVAVLHILLAVPALDRKTEARAAD